MENFSAETLIIHMIITHKTPFIKSKSSKQLLISTFGITIITLLITFNDIAKIFDLSRLPYFDYRYEQVLLDKYGRF